MKIIIKAIVCILCLVILNACSAFTRMKSYVPTEETEWQLLTKEKKSASRCIGEYESTANNIVAINQCNGFEARLHKISHSGFSLLGPPLIPFFPLPTGYQGSITLDLINSFNLDSANPNSTECPNIEVIEPEIISVEFKNKTFYKNENKTRCWYKLSETDTDVLILKILFNEVVCDSGKIVLKRQVEYGYVALCSISF